MDIPKIWVLYDVVSESYLDSTGQYIDDMQNAARWTLEEALEQLCVNTSLALFPLREEAKTVAEKAVDVLDALALCVEELPTEAGITPLRIEDLIEDLRALLVGTSDKKGLKKKKPFRRKRDLER